MRSTFKVAVPAVALLTALTACGGSATGTAGPTSAASAPAATEPAAPAATTEPAAEATTGKATTGTTKAAGNGNGSGSGKRKCAVDDLKVSIAAQGTGQKDEKGMVVITNRSGKNCTVNGWLTIALYNAANESVDVPTKKVNEPGPAETVEVQAGGSAFAGIKWTQCDKGDTSCGAGNTIRWSLDDSLKGPVATLEGFPAPEQSNITMKALKVGTFQPSNQGVVAW